MIKKKKKRDTRKVISDNIISLSLRREDELEIMSLIQIQPQIYIVKMFLEILQKKIVRLRQSIILYKKDKIKTEKIKNELQEVNTSIETVSNYLDRLYDFESFAE